MDKVIYVKKGHIAIITLNNPKHLNALNAEFMKELANVFDSISEEKDIYTVILTGTGNCFISGADIKEMLPLSAVEMLQWAKIGSNLNNKIEELAIPVIAAINGYALGGGCELSLACDIRIASEKAKLGFPEASLGVICGAGGTQRLPRLIGEGKAKELLYTGRIISAWEAEKIGLVNEVAPPESLMDKALYLAEEITKNAPIALKQIKCAVNSGRDMCLKSALNLERQAFCVCCSSEDKAVGMKAFINKNKTKKFINR